MRSLVIFAFGAALAGNAFSCDLSRGTNDSISSWEWKPSYDIALKLPKNASAAYGEGPGHNSDLWNIPAGKVVARYGTAPISWWADDVRTICSARIDGYPAKIYRIKQNGEAKLAAVFKTVPLGKDFVVTISLENQKGFSDELGALLSITFVNNPDRMKLTGFRESKDIRLAVLTNEIGEQKAVKIGDFISEQAGHVDFIGDDYVTSKSTRERGGKEVFEKHVYKLNTN